MVPSSWGITSRSRPLHTSTSGSGTVSATRALSASSDQVSLFGHQTLGPIPWSVVTTHGRPRLSAAHVKPPSHGGRVATWGAPWYQAVTVCTEPTA